MKQYKIVRVELSFADIGMANYEKVEAVMTDMANDGWEVVCTSPQPGVDAAHMLVTFCKEE